MVLSESSFLHWVHLSVLTEPEVVMMTRQLKLWIETQAEMRFLHMVTCVMFHYSTRVISLFVKLVLLSAFNSICVHYSQF